MNSKELGEYAVKRGLNLGQAEKDYYQNMLLFILYQRVGRELVFKGGTALAKCYGLNRFSEDLDFTALETKDYFGMVEEGLASFGMRYSAKRQEGKESAAMMVKVEGPLYKGSEKTLCSVTVEVSFREKVVMEPRVVTIGYHMDIIPAFDVYVMREEEIMAEKTRALMTRVSARDLYDIGFLVAKGVNVEKELINEKLSAVNLKFDYKAFSRKCREARRVWNSELKSLVRNVPDFDDCIKRVLEFYGKFM
ncbi:MAG: nucleotidyl transferase AbiEii/AbiGii toxin family protein [Candidatus Micrarchaeia archaeon]